MRRMKEVCLRLIDGCSLALCSATVSVVSSGICHRNKVNCMTSHKIVSFTLHYITLHLELHYFKMKNEDMHISEACGVLLPVSGDD